MTLKMRPDRDLDFLAQGKPDRKVPA